MSSVPVRELGREVIGHTVRLPSAFRDYRVIGFDDADPDFPEHVVLTLQQVDRIARGDHGRRSIILRPTAVLELLDDDEARS